MSRLKALEVLGISSAMLEEEKARILGSLGIKAWGTPGIAAMVENPQDSAAGCRLSRKRRSTASEVPRVPPPMCGMAAPSPSQVSGLFVAYVYVYVLCCCCSFSLLKHQKPKPCLVIM